MHRKTKNYIIIASPLIILGLAILNSASAYALNSPSATINVGSSSVSGTLTPNTNNPYSYTHVEVPITIHVSDSKDYQIFLKADKSDLTGTKNSNNKLLSVEGQKVALTDMENRWGYHVVGSADSVDSNNTKLYSKVPSTEALEIESGNATLNETTHLPNDIDKTIYLGFGARVNANQAADIYKGRVEVSIIATPDYITLFDMETRGMTMQDIDPSICANTPTPSSNATTAARTAANATTLANDGEGIDKVPTVALVDARADNKSYLVAKLADGNCWMIQNLALPGETKITSMDSDIKKNTIPAKGTPGTEEYVPADTYILPASSANGFNDDINEFMYNATHINATQNTWGYFDGDGDGFGDPLDSAYCHTTSSNSGNGCTGTNSGSYYSWRVATATSYQKPVGANLDENDHTYARAGDLAPSSICPKGWILPSAVVYNPSTSSELEDGILQNLIASYRASLSNLSTILGNAKTGRIRGSRAYHMGSYSYAWSSSADFNSTVLNAYYANGDGTSIGGNAVRNGCSVRCVALSIPQTSD